MDLFVPLAWLMAYSAGGQSPPDIAFCAAKARLKEAFLEAVQQLTALQDAQANAVIVGDPEFSRFDLLIHMANEKKAAAKYALLAHIDAHGCREG